MSERKPDSVTSSKSSISSMDSDDADDEGDTVWVPNFVGSKFRGFAETSLLLNFRRF